MREQLVDEGDLLVGDLLQLLLDPFELVRRELTVLLGRLEVVAPLAARFRTATLPSSALWRTTFTSSLRRSSVNGGNASRMTFPSFVGLMPRSEAMIAFSIAPSELLS